MKTTAMEQTESVSDVLCDVCGDSTRVEGYALAGIAPRHEIPHLADLCISQGIRIGFLRQFVHSLPDFRPHRTARFLAAQPVYAVH